MLCACTTLTFRKGKTIIPAVIFLRVLSEAAEGQCFLLGGYALYHSKLLHTAEVLVKLMQTVICLNHCFLPGMFHGSMFKEGD